MKYKKLTKEQILISIDRLTRFKKTRDKYLRVFTDILMSSLLEPKLKKSDIEKMDYKELAECVSEIFNSSINNTENNTSINHKLKDYENSVFVNDDGTQMLLDNNINYCGALKLIPEDCPINLKWLKSLSTDANLDEMRKQHLLKFPIRKIILVEGITEEILLPAFSKFLGYDFYAEGIQIIAAGGKNQVVKMYYELSEDVKVPIFILLDKDAEENINQIRPKLRSIDKIHLVSCGEFEDLLSKSLIVKTVNTHFENFMAISEADLSEALPTAKILEEIFKTKGLHEFKKAEFAKLVRENISENTDISAEIYQIIAEISAGNKLLDTQICS
mgnify:FL=1